MRSKARTATIAGVSALLAVPSVAFADGACESLAIRADARALASSPSLVGRLHASFDGRPDVDACAKIRITRAARFDIEVTLPDGRIARRSVPRADDIAPVLEALLVVPKSPAPPPDEGDAASEADPPAPPPAPPAVLTTSPMIGERVVDADVSRRTPSDRRLGFEVSALTGVRLGDGSNGSIGAMGVGVQTFVDVGGWLVGAGGRLDGYTATSSPISTIELSVLLGHRFRWTDVTLDIIAGPAALVGSTQNDRPLVLDGNGRPLLVRDDRPVLPRLLAGARLNLRARSTFRPFVGVDGQIGTSWRSDAGDASLPLAMIGVSLGATVGTR